ncbi:tetratricopeptide repeat-containing glycosyltransferase family protein [Burkholderia cenocepacia]|uniref:tetratricopeptide repeat-containing glycosyltransferase family protein n=1 Tax=Burkholderia cenocepacia TaxID=95486 RepID=UPI0006AC5982|nr:tetratricopeptide repeat-containing glycosyltransferase family protein [Burkholderia cenocepacia]KOR17536.1 tetratricopeptide TPR_2 repeat protein [Burkholderia cenocepacia]MBR7983215.1 glycosyltransferase family protein [Burkholderia cenocepacia]
MQTHPAHDTPAFDDTALQVHGIDDTTLDVNDDAVATATQMLIDRGEVGRAAALAAAHWDLRPDSPTAAFNCGYAMQMAGRHADALAPYRRTLELAPSWPSLKNNLALAIRLTGGDPEVEFALIEGALDDNPDDPRAWTNAVVTRLDRFDLDGALRAATRAATLAPDNALALNNTSLALKEARRRDEAEQYAALAVERAPHSATYRHNLSLLELARGDYASGWVNYESRWEGSAELRGNLPAFSGPRWRGESLKGKTLLVWGEQGLGDALQFCRYVPQLAERVHREGGRIVWNAFPVMGALLERSVARHVDVFDTSTRIEDLPAFDFELPLMSVPGMLGLDGNTIATTVPYLHADPAATDAWRTALAGEKRLKVGLAWTGNLTHPRNRFRRVGLERFAEAFGGLQQDVAFYSLQPGAQHDIEAARSNGFVVTDTTREWKTLDDTAAFIGALDLVITVCTSAAHLSGALGQFTWVLLDANPHWVWQHDRRDSAFYPSVSLYRQKTFADWQPVLDEATADLRDLVG